MAQKYTAKQIDLTYRGPNGLGFSPSMQRARKPFLIPNIIVGSLIFAFAGGVYAYSISAVKQDDFSDLEDLLPPVAERANLRSIEDEARAEAQALTADPSRSALDFTSSPSALSGAIPGTTSTDIRARGGVLSFLPRRLSDNSWLVKHGVVERETGNVIVWGAPHVDDIGRVEGTHRGPKLV